MSNLSCPVTHTFSDRWSVLEVALNDWPTFRLDNDTGMTGGETWEFRGKASLSAWEYGTMKQQENSRDPEIREKIDA